MQAVQAGLIAILALSVIVAGCTIANTTRLTIVKDVNIAEELSPSTIRVQPGDEIRLVNLRRDHVQIEILHLDDKGLACERGFSTWLGTTKEAVHLKANDTVSLCFDEPGLVNYIVRGKI